MKNSLIQSKRISKSQDEGIYVYMSISLYIKTRSLLCWSHEKAIKGFGTKVANFSSVMINTFMINVFEKDKAQETKIIR